MADEFIGSSERWGDQATARLCQLIMEANDGMAQQIAENRTDLLDLYTLDQLRQHTDDLGLSLPFLAVHYDRPDSLRYLHNRGIDLSQPCDPMGYGTVYFYAIAFQRRTIIQTLNELLYSYSVPCETTFKLPPIYYAKRNDDVFMLETLQALLDKEQWAFHFFLKNFLRSKFQRQYKRIKKSVLLIQRIVRGFLARRYFALLQLGAISETSSMMSDGSSSYSKQHSKSSHSHSHHSHRHRHGHGHHDHSSHGGSSVRSNKKHNKKRSKQKSDASTTSSHMQNSLENDSFIEESEAEED